LRIVATTSRLEAVTGTQESAEPFRSNHAIVPPASAPLTAALRTIGSARVIGRRLFVGAH
jgi:hypothetical protein